MRRDEPRPENREDQPTGVADAMEAAALVNDADRPAVLEAKPAPDAPPEPASGDDAPRATEPSAPEAPQAGAEPSPAANATNVKKPTAEPLSPERREWLALAERIFGHPRYAILIMAALALAAVTQSRPVLAALAVFFGVEIGARAWVLKALARAREKQMGGEAWFLALDALATASLAFSVAAPGSWLAGGMWLRLARLARGMYMLRMLRVFRFLSLDAMVYSMGVAISALALTTLAALTPSIALYAGVALLVETACRAFAALRVVESPARRRAELAFAALDALATVPLLGLVDGLSPGWAGLRAARFLVMLNPLGSLAGALRRVAARDAVRKEATMLTGMFVLLMAATAAAVLWLYPRMDLNGDGATGGPDYAPWQVLFYGFRILLDPGNAPADAFSPWLAALTMVIVLSGVFFFALFVGLGSNVMHYLLEELANSPLSARVSLLLAGDNEQSIAILRAFDAMCARMRRSFASAWLFIGPAREGARALGRWLAVREIEPGSRETLARFRLSGVRGAVLFQRAWTEKQAAHEMAASEMADLHALARELRRRGEAPGLVVCDSAPPAHARAVYEEALGMEVVDSAALKARMLYQMHHCAHMPELGMRMMDAVNGETGLYARPWPARIEPAGATSRIIHEAGSAELGAWLSHCFARGLNLLAARTSEGRHVLFGDLRKLRAPVEVTDVLGLGCEPDGWDALMRDALDAGGNDDVDETAEPPLAAFTWPDKWDLKMIFVGWHDGLPAMVEEMAQKHHKLSVYVLYPGPDAVGQRHAERLLQIGEDNDLAARCKLETEVVTWDGMNTQMLVPLLKGCKVIMLYPEETGRNNEDSTLELWFHEIARLLDARKAKVKWWTPPKLMVLPRAAANVPALREAARDYPRLEVHVGSPDAFHDVFMARQMLARTMHAGQKDDMRSEIRAFDFMHVVLGDAVIVEGVDAPRILARENASWEEIHREAWKRGWMLAAVMLPEEDEPPHPVMRLLDRAFPAETRDAGSRMRVLAGAPTREMPAPAQAARLLFCRRGVLDETDAAAANDATETHEADKAATGPTGASEASEAKVPAESADMSEDKGANAAPAGAPSGENPEPDMGKTPDSGTEFAEETEAAQTMAPEAASDDAGEAAEGAGTDAAALAPRDDVKEGELMPESPWPETADARLLRVLQKQVNEALELLSRSTEEGLVKLAGAMDKDESGAVSEDIMAALTDLQNVDRVMQRLRNVETCLADWAGAAPTPEGEPRWREAVESRYVMEEERLVLRSEL